MKNMKMLYITLMAIAGCAQSTFAGSNRSPNGFEAPQCTWAVDLFTNTNGWDLDFSRSWGRDARKWPDLIENARVTHFPRMNDILVLDDWDGNEYGHVAWIWYVERDRKSGLDGNYVLVLHTNMRIGKEYFRYAGVPFRYAWFYHHREWDSVYCFHNEKWYPLGAILRED